MTEKSTADIPEITAEAKIHELLERYEQAWASQSDDNSVLIERKHLFTLIVNHTAENLVAAPALERPLLLVRAADELKNKTIKPERDGIVKQFYFDVALKAIDIQSTK